MMVSFPSKTLKNCKNYKKAHQVLKFYMNIISDRDMYRYKPCNVFITYLWALKQLTSFFISIFLFGKPSFDIFYKNQ